MISTHQLRLALREWGSRLAAGGSLTVGDDVFYLTPDELFMVGADHSATVIRRRAHRDTLAKMDLPVRFSESIDFAETVQATSRPSVLHGVGRVAGVAVGRVRVLRSADDDVFRCGSGSGD